jgi:transposase
LLERGVEVVRVPPKLMGQARRASRARGKSDAIDALAVARAALANPELPVALLAGPEREIRLLVCHPKDLVAERARVLQRLRWHLHDLVAALEPPAQAFSRRRWRIRLADARPSCPSASRSASPANSWSAWARSASRSTGSKAEIAALVADHAAPLLALPGCGPLTAAKLVGEIAGVERFALRPSSPAPRAWRRSRPPQGCGCVIASTATATAS